jgi:ABC-type Mn2+/Zn2+ transport system permease subunit
MLVYFECAITIVFSTILSFGLLLHWLYADNNNLAAINILGTYNATINIDDAFIGSGPRGRRPVRQHRL